MEWNERVVACLSVAGLILGCLTPEEQAARAAQRDDLAMRANAPLICTSKDECEAAWGRAVAWVSQDCGWKIRTQTDYVIETEGPSETSPSLLACRINRVPLDAKSARFDLTVACGYKYSSCYDEITLKKARFGETIRKLPATLRRPDE